MVFVREMSSRTRSTECHAFLCDTVTTARQVALSVSLAFKMYEKRLDGKPHRFQVDLGSGGHKSKKSSSGDGKVTECDAWRIILVFQLTKLFLLFQPPRSLM